MKCRDVVAAVLIYVALDFCLAAMPGAFVFDANDSVETTLSGRAREAGVAGATVLQPIAAHWDAVVIRRDVSAAVAQTPTPRVPVRRHVPGATPSPHRSPSADEPH